MSNERAAVVMRIVVPVKQVAALDEEFVLGTDETSVDRDYLEFDLNEWDGFSVEAAVQIKEAAEGDTEVVVVTVGDDDTNEVLLTCLANGADRAVRIWDEDLVDLEPLSVATILAAFVRTENPALVLCGVQSSDAASSATGIALAGLLELPHVAVAKAIECAPAGDAVVVDRELEGGAIEQLSLPLPALITIQTGANEPRYATLRAIKQAGTKPFAELDLSDLGLGLTDIVAAKGARTIALHHPTRAGRGAKMLEGDAAGIAEQIIAIVDGAFPTRGGT